jgi:hypothetical protein
VCVSEKGEANVGGGWGGEKGGGEEGLCVFERGEGCLVHFSDPQHFLQEEEGGERERRVCVYVCVCTRVYMYACACVRVYMYVCLCVSVCIY